MERIKINETDLIENGFFIDLGIEGEFELPNEPFYVIENGYIEILGKWHNGNLSPVDMVLGIIPENLENPIWGGWKEWTLLLP